ncbi:MAG: efflux RND transporter periplasmic adaptor subunit [Phycisphaerales bacterium]|nr:efflux RND transporter periplasmic adaptor subunit [Phycisphaerales bacterium]
MNIQRLTCVLVFTMILSGCSKNNNQAQQPQTPTVTVAMPLVQNVIEWERYTGRLQPIETVDIQGQISGPLQSTHFAEGEIVKEGDLLAVIDPRPFEVATTKAEAAVRVAEANLQRSNAMLQQAIAQQNQAIAAESFAKTRYENAQQAYESNSIAREQVDARESEYAQAKSQTEAANANVSSADAEIINSEASILSAQAELENAELNLEYTRIEAPISGRISRLQVSKGNLIQGGSATGTVIATIVALDPIYVHIEAAEQDLLKYLRQSTFKERLKSDYRHPLFLSLLDEEGYPHAGQIDFAENRVDQETGTILIRGILKNTSIRLIPGMFASIQIPRHLGEQSETMLIPDEAISSDQDQRLVLVVGEDSIVYTKPVELGPIVDGLRVIRSGLTGEEQVIISGLQFVFPGMTVNTSQGAIESVPENDGLPEFIEPISRDQWIRHDSSIPTPEANKLYNDQQPGDDV